MRIAFGRISAVLSDLAAKAWIILLLLMMFHVVTNGLLRKFLNSPIEGTNEWTQYWYMPLIAFGGFVFTEIRNEHIEARFVFDKMPAKIQAELQLLSRFLVIIVCIAFSWFGFLEAGDAFDAKLTGGVIGLPIWPVAFAGPVAFALMAFIGINRVSGDLQEHAAARTPGGDANAARPARTED